MDKLESQLTQDRADGIIIDALHVACRERDILKLEILELRGLVDHSQSLEGS
jgi:hypothetical protein